VGYKLCKFCENRARDTPLRGVYIPHFGQIWVKISILGVLHPCRCTDGGEIWHGGGEKPQNRPLSKLNTGRLTLRAMLPVTNGNCNSWTHLSASSINLSEQLHIHPRKHAVTFPANKFVLGWAQETKYTWGAPLNRPCAAAMRPVVIFLWPVVVYPMQWINPQISFFRLSVSLCLLTDRLSNDYVHNSLPISQNFSCGSEMWSLRRLLFVRQTGSS